MTNNLDRLAAFLRSLAQALHISGMPAHDLERHLNAMGQRLGVRVDCFAVLTMLTLNITTDDTTQRVEMLRLRFYDYNMARLIALERLIREVDGIGSLERCEGQLKDIMNAPPLWSGGPFVLLGFLLSASVAVLLRGGWTEMQCAGLVGMLFVGAYLALARVPRLGPAAPVILCTAAAFCAHLLSLVFPQQTPFITAVAGVVLLLPGFNPDHCHVRTRHTEPPVRHRATGRGIPATIHDGGGAGDRHPDQPAPPACAPHWHP